MPSKTIPSVAELRQQIAEGKTVTPAAWAAAHAAANLAVVSAEVAAELRAAEEAAHLAAQREAFTAAVVKDKALLPGAVHEAKAATIAAIELALSEWISFAAGRNSSVLAAESRARALGLVNGEYQVRVTEGVQAGLRVNNDRVTGAGNPLGAIDGMVTAAVSAVRRGA